MNLAGNVKQYLDLVSAVLAPAEVSSQELLAQTQANGEEMELGNSIVGVVSLHGAAYSGNIISLERLVEVVVTPFVQLLQLKPGGAQPYQEYMRELLFAVWHDAIRKLISGNFSKGPDGTLSLGTPYMSPEKRSDLIKAMEAAHLFQVGIYGRV